MRKRNKAVEDLYDLFGLRILCETVDNCYTILGLVHRLWKPLDGRFKDYIAMPKSNGYRSLHTTVFVPPGENQETGKMLEIQIRTHEMHQNAENGVAGHWLYKQGVRSAKTGEISIVNRLKNWYSPDSGDQSQLFLEDIKKELLKDSIYVFTPQGKVIELPRGATPLDFAYHIHSAIGDHCSLAKADGMIIPLSAPLKNTQVVEILTSPASHPSLNWLHSVKTAKARSKIRVWLQLHDESAAAGKSAAEKKKAEETRLRQLNAEAKNRNREQPGGQMVVQNAHSPVFKVRVGDEKNMMIRFAKCCNPILGDPIVGYISRGRGIIIHRRGCENTAHIPDFAEREIATQWENASFPVKRFRIEARKGEDIFAEIEGAVKKFQGHLIEGKLEDAGGNRLKGYFTIQLETQDDVSKVQKHIRAIPVIYNIQGIG
jgi:GTP pyrophosphokinase